MFQKNSIEDVVFRIIEYNGQGFLNVRSFLKNIPIEKPIATKKGLCIKLGQSQEFFESAKKAEKVIQDLKREKKK